MVEEVGSMEIVGVYRDSGIHEGLEQTKTDFEDATGAGKSFNQEMIRLDAISVATGTAIADIGLSLLGMFKGALTSSPYLLGAFTRIKTDIQLMSWALTKGLKPAFDLIADAVHALRSGDWEAFKDSAIGAVEGLILALERAWSWMKEHSPEWVSSIMTRLEETYDAIKNFDWEAEGLWGGIKFALQTIWNEVILDLLPEIIMDIVGAFVDVGGLIGDKIWDGILNWKSEKNAEWDAWWYSMGNSWGEQVVNGFKAMIKDLFVTDWQESLPRGAGRPVLSEFQEPSSGAGSSSGKAASTIIVDFGNSNFNLASGLDIDQLADTVSRKIADVTAWGNF